MKKAALIIGAILVLVFGGFQGCVYHLRGKFEDRVKGYKTLADLQPAPVPDDQNVAAGLKEITAWLTKHDERFGSRPLIVYAYNTWADAGDKEKKTRDEYLQSVAPVFDRLDEVMKRPHFRSATDLSEGVRAELAEMTDIQRIAALLAARTRAGDIVAGARQLLLFGDRCDLPFMIGHAMRGTLEMRAIRALQTAPPFDVSRVRAALEPILVAAEKPKGPATRPLEQERATWISITKAWGRGESIGERADNETPHAWYRRPAMYRDAFAYLDLLDTAISACGTSARQAHEFAERFETASESDGPFLTRYVRPTVHMHFASYASTVASLRLARVALALMEAHEKSGKWPEALPGPELIDPFSGKPFRYVRADKAVRVFAAKEGGLDSLERAGLAWRWPR